MMDGQELAKVHQNTKDSLPISTEGKKNYEDKPEEKNKSLKKSRKETSDPFTASRTTNKDAISSEGIVQECKGSDATEASSEKDSRVKKIIQISIDGDKIARRADFGSDGPSHSAAEGNEFDENEDDKYEGRFSMSNIDTDTKSDVKAHMQSTRPKEPSSVDSLADFHGLESKGAGLESKGAKAKVPSGNADKNVVLPLWQKPLELKMIVKTKEGKDSKTFTVGEDKIPRYQFFIEESSILNKKIRNVVDKSFKFELETGKRTKVKLNLTAVSEVKGLEMKEKMMEVVENLIESLFVGEIYVEHVSLNKSIDQVEKEIQLGLQRTVRIYQNDEKLIVVGYKPEAEKTYAKIQGMLKPSPPSPGLNIQTKVESYIPLDYDSFLLFCGFKEKDRLLQKYSHLRIDVSQERVKVFGPPKETEECCTEIAEWPSVMERGKIERSDCTEFVRLLSCKDTKMYIESMWEKKNVNCLYFIKMAVNKIVLFGKSNEEARKAWQLLNEIIQKEHLAKGNDNLVILAYPEFDIFCKKYSEKQFIHKEHLDGSVTLVATRDAMIEFQKMAKSINEKSLQQFERESGGSVKHGTLNEQVTEKRVTLLAYGEDNMYLMEEEALQLEFRKRFQEITILKEKDGTLVLLFKGSMSKIKEQGDEVHSFFGKIKAEKRELDGDIYNFIMHKPEVHKFLNQLLQKMNIHCYWYVTDKIKQNKYHMCVKARENHIAVTAIDILIKSISLSQMQDNITPSIQEKLGEIQKKYVAKCTILGNEQGLSEISCITTIDLHEEVEKNILFALSSNFSSKVLSIRLEKYIFLRRHFSEEIRKLEQKYGVLIMLDTPPHIVIKGDLQNNNKIHICEGEIKKLCNGFIDIVCVRVDNSSTVEKLRDVKGCEFFTSVEERLSCSVSQTLSRPEQICTYSLLEKDFHVVVIYGQTIDLTVDAVVCPVNNCLFPIGYADDFLKGDKDLKFSIQENFIDKKNPMKYKSGDIIPLLAASSYPCHSILLTVMATQNKPIEKNSIFISMLKLFQYCEKENIQSVSIPVQISDEMTATMQANEIINAMKQCYTSLTKSSVKEVYLCIVDHHEVDTVITSINETRFSDDLDMEYFDWRPSILSPSDEISASERSAQIQVDVTVGSLVDQEVDILVNTVGYDLDLQNGVVSRSILEKAGMEIQLECKTSFPDGVNYGEVIITSSGKMRNCRRICHIVLTKWHHRTNLSLQVMANLIWQCLHVATHNRYRSVAFPAFGTGKLEYPPRKVVEIIFATVSKYGVKNPDTSVKEVLIVLHSEDKTNITIFNAVSSKWKNLKRYAALQQDNGLLEILECTVPTVYGNVCVQVLPKTTSMDILDDDMLAYFDQDKIKDFEVDRDGFGRIVLMIPHSSTLDNAMKEILSLTDRGRLTRVSLVFNGMTKESTERVMKTVRQKLSSEKSDKGYLQLVKIYVDLPEPFNEILSKPPQDGDHTGVFQFLKKKTVWRKDRPPTAWIKTVPENSRQNLNLFITGKKNEVHEAKKEIENFIRDIQMAEVRRSKAKKRPHNWALERISSSGDVKRVSLTTDVCEALDFGLAKNEKKVKYPHLDCTWIYDLENREGYEENDRKKYKLVVENTAGFQSPAAKDSSSVDPSSSPMRDGHDMFASVEGEVNSGTLDLSKHQIIEDTIKKFDVKFHKQSTGKWDIQSPSGNFDDFLMLNDAVKENISRKKTSVLSNSQNHLLQKPSQEAEFSKSQSKKEVKNALHFTLEELEFEMLKFFCGESRIFKGQFEYKHKVFTRQLDSTETEDDLQCILKSKMDFIKSLSTSEISCIKGISDEKFHEIKREISDTKEIYCLRSTDRQMLILYAANYEKLGEGKHRAEIALGLKQQSKGRRNRVFVTETDLSSSKKGPISASGVGQTTERPVDFSRSLSSSSGPKIEMTFKTSEGIIVKVYNGNILSLDVDCIVNAANENLNHGGGVAYVIAAAAGYDFEKESVDYIQRNGPILEGSCCTTSAGKLKYKSVIHTVGPKWYTYNDKTECCRVLRKSVECCFFEAEVNGMVSIATPSISAGIFGVPKEVCCKEYGKAVEDFSRKNGNTTCLKEIHFIDKDAGMISMIQKEFSQKFNKMSSSNTGSSNSSGGYNAGGQGRISRSLSSPEDPEIAKKESLNRNDDFAGSVSKFQKQFMATKDLKVIVVQDDIINRKVDTIVCPQDENISNKGGIARAIEKVCDNSYKKAVKDLVYVMKSEIRKVKASPSSLPFQYVLQSVPPRYDKFAEANRSSFDKDLEKTIKNILRHCSDKGDVTSLAMPVLGIGKDGLDTPVLVFAKCFLIVLLGEIKTASKFGVKEIHIVTNDISAAVIIADELGKEKSFNQVTSFSRTRNRGDKGNTKPDTKMAIAGKSFRGKLEDGSENCIICTEPNIRPHELTCGHIFCKNCVQEIFKVKPVCPTCGSIQGVIKGDQPPGTMKRRETRYSLPGYTGCGTIEIEYDIYGGVQGEEHPNPGKSFKGIKRVALLPNNMKGKLIADLLRIAFDRKLVFTIGHSRTTGQEGVVTWNDIHHKTSSSYGHQFGYPDEGYFDRVLDELKIKGVTEKDL